MFKIKVFALTFLFAISSNIICLANKLTLEYNSFSTGKTASIEKFYTIIDISNSASPEQVYEKLKNGEGELRKGPVYSSGYTGSNIWLAIKINNTDESIKNMVFEVGDPHINVLEVYKISDTTFEYLGTGGDLQKFYDRKIADNNFVFPFPLNSLESLTLLLKIDNKGNTTIMPFSIKTFPDHYRSTVTEYVIWGLLTGVLLFVCVFSMVIWFSLKEKLFLFYSLYIFAITMWILGNNGLGYQFIYPNLPQIMLRVRPVSASFGFALMLHVMQLFVKQSKANSRFFKATNFIKKGLSVLALILFIPYDFSDHKMVITVFLVVSDLFFLSAVLLLFAGLIEKIKQGQKSAYIYLAAVSVFFLASVFTIFVRLGIIEASAFSLNGIYISILVEILILSVAIGQRYNLLKKEELRLQLEIEIQKKEVAHKIELATILERNRIAADLHDDIGSGISGLRVFSEMAERKNSIEELKNDTMKISATAAILADKIREVVWTLDAENKNIEDFLLYIQKYGTRFFENSNIIFSMDIPMDIASIELNSEKQKQLLLALKEIFNNALKHSGASTLNCIIELNDTFKILISDNGKGFGNGKSGGGNGLMNIQSRITSIKGTVDVKSDKGVSFTIKIPVSILAADNISPSRIVG